MKRIVIFAALALFCAVEPASAQRRGRSSRDVDYTGYNVPYDGRLTFVRVRYAPAFTGRFERNPGWAHDYPTAERHLMRILTELSLVRANMDGSNILMLDDPDLFKYPMAYLSEPGFWDMSDPEIAGLRNYILKGGFLIVDDFRDEQWNNFAAQVRRAFPAGQLVRLDDSHPIFDAFFHIGSLDRFRDPNFRSLPEFWGMYEDNDPTKRLTMIVNYNNDIGDYWEWSDSGWVPIDLSNDAYKLGVNYIVYSMTH